MSTYSKTHVENLDAMIHQLLVVKWNMSLREIQQHLEDNGIQIGDVHFIARRRDKVIRRRVAQINRATKQLNAAEYNSTTNLVIESLWKIANSATTSPGVKSMTLKNIGDLSHRRLMTFTLLDVFLHADIKGSLTAEKEVPDERLDTIVQAIKNNQLQPRVGAFKYLPDSQISPNDNIAPKPKPATEPTEHPAFVTGLPLKYDRSFSVPKK